MKKILSLVLAIAMTFTLIACGDEEPAEVVEEVTEEAVVPEEPDVTEEVADVEEAEEEEEGLTDDQQQIIDLFEMMNATYKEYLESGFNAEEGTFVSPITDTLYLAPKFTVADANGDNQNDIIIWGELGLRDKQLAEVYFYNEEDGEFYANTFSGYVEDLAQASIVVLDEDREVDQDIYYTDYIVYELNPEGPIAKYTHNIVENGEDESEWIDQYFEGEDEITEDEFIEKVQLFSDAIIPLEYTEMTADSILAEFPD